MNAEHILIDMVEALLRCMVQAHFQEGCRIILPLSKAFIRRAGTLAQPYGVGRLGW